MPTPAGWYDDPDDPNQQRYWNGEEWTDRRQPPPPEAPNTEAPKEEKAPGEDGCGKGCGLLLLGALAIGVLFWVLGSCEGGGSGSFDAEVTGYQPANPASLDFTARVENTGDESATPSCTVRFQDSSGAYSGFDVFDLEDPIAAGDDVMFRGSVVIEDQGAGFVTESEIKCE